MILETIAVLFTVLTENVITALYRTYSYRASYTYRSYTYRSYYNYGYYYYYGYSSYGGYVGAIAGGVFGAAVLIGIVIALICCCMKSQGRTGRVISSNTGTVSYISGQPTIAYQTTTVQQGMVNGVQQPGYVYSNQGYAAGPGMQQPYNPQPYPPPSNASFQPPPAYNDVAGNPPPNPPMPQPDTGYIPVAPAATEPK